MPPLNILLDALAGMYDDIVLANGALEYVVT